MRAGIQATLLFALIVAPGAANAEGFWRCTYDNPSGLSELVDLSVSGKKLHIVINMHVMMDYPIVEETNDTIVAMATNGTLNTPTPYAFLYLLQKSTKRMTSATLSVGGQNRIQTGTCNRMDQ